MARICTMAATLLLGVSLAAAQTTTTTGTGTEDLADLGSHSPQENVRAGAVRARAPGNIVNEARSRHSDLAANRLEFQRGGQAGDDDGTDDNNDGADTGSGGLDDLLGGLLDSGGLGSLLGGGGLGSLLGGGTGTSTGGATTNPNIPSNLTPEAIQLLQSSGFDIDELFPPDGSTAKSQSRQSSSILQDRWPGKSEAVSQTSSDEEEDKFSTRWADAMLSTLFTGITIGLNTPQFIDLLADGLRDLFNREPADTAENTDETADDGGDEAGDQADDQ